MPISAIDCISLAFEHTKRQLFRPFRFGQWVRLAVVGLLAGELASGGGNFSIPSQPGQQGSLSELGEIFHKIDPAILASLITILVITGIVFVAVMIYISSVMRFVLFDSVVKKECHIRAGWSLRQEHGWRYFLWQLGLMLAAAAGVVILIGGPAAFAFGMGWFNSPRAHIAPLVMTGIFALILFIGFTIGMSLVHVLTKDFVIPQMAFEDIGALEAWRRLWPMIEGETKGYAIYVGMKIVLSIVAGIAIGIVGLVIGLILAIPLVGAVIAGVIAAKGAGLTWNVVTITAAVVAGVVLMLVFLLLISLITVPALVFFPAYSIYFFAARYRPLSLALYSPAPQSALPQGASPPFTPPPLPA